MVVGNSGNSQATTPNGLDGYLRKPGRPKQNKRAPRGACNCASRGPFLFYGTLTDQPGGRKVVRRPAGVPHWKQEAACRTARAPHWPCHCPCLSAICTPRPRPAFPTPAVSPPAPEAQAMAENRNQQPDPQSAPIAPLIAEERGFLGLS